MEITRVCVLGQGSKSKGLGESGGGQVGEFDVCAKKHQSKGTEATSEDFFRLTLQIRHCLFLPPPSSQRFAPPRLS